MACSLKSKKDSFPGEQIGLKIAKRRVLKTNEINLSLTQNEVLTRVCGIKRVRLFYA
jgi:hypothetical protein